MRSRLRSPAFCIARRNAARHRELFGVCDRASRRNGICGSTIPGLAYISMLNKLAFSTHAFTLAQSRKTAMAGQPRACPAASYHKCDAIQLACDRSVTAGHDTLSKANLTRKPRMRALVFLLHSHFIVPISFRHKFFAASIRRSRPRIRSAEWQVNTALIA